MAAEKRNTPSTSETRHHAQLEQAGLSFGEIANLADCINTIGTDALGEITPAGRGYEIANQVYAICALAKQVGLICDLTARKLGQEGSCDKDSAEDWLLPPAWRWAAEKAAETPNTI